MYKIEIDQKVRGLLQFGPVVDSLVVSKVSCAVRAL
jgi:hypothetical protein